MTTEHAPTVDAIEVYWRPGCPFCLTLRPRLHRSGLPLHEVNIRQDTQAAARLRNRFLGQLWHCLQHGQLYDEAKAFPHYHATHDLAAA